MFVGSGRTCAVWLGQEDGVEHAASASFAGCVGKQGLDEGGEVAEEPGEFGVGQVQAATV